MRIYKLPWKFAHLKNAIGYRNWEAVKHFKKKKKDNLVESLRQGKRLLFVHIPKTAGVSIIYAYEEFLAEARHSPVLLYQFVLGEQFHNFSTFSIVRNPWARIFSAYHFLINGGLGESDSMMGKILSMQCPSFEQFIKEWLPEKGVCSYGHFVPQYEFVCGWKGDLIVDVILKVERLDQDWPRTAEKLGMPFRKISRLNVSSKKDYRKYYDRDAIEIVAKLYRKDIQLFDYQFGA